MEGDKGIPPSLSLRQCISVCSPINQLPAKQGAETASHTHHYHEEKY